VFVTGTFDDWGKTVKLDRVGDLFVKEVTISPVQKIHYKVWAYNSFLISRTFLPLPLDLFDLFPSVDLAVSLRQQGIFH
jgi:hypothetical protein